MQLNLVWLDPVVRAALEEDIGPGDVTTSAVVPAGLPGTGRIISREKGVVAGLLVAARVFALLDPEVAFRAGVADGARVEPGQTLAFLSGPARSLLTGERVALNFLQRLSGIATATARATGALQYYRTVVVDTRKTTPGQRWLEKYAVRVGGGFNHRFGLYDAVLIKDNHLRLAGGIRPAVAAARRNVSPLVKIEVEVDSLDQIEEAIDAGVDVVMLDNMDIETMRLAVRKIAGRALVEVSGGVTLERLPEIGKLGVDLVSMGSLTHSAPSLDVALEIDDPAGDPG